MAYVLLGMVIGSFVTTIFNRRVMSVLNKEIEDLNQSVLTLFCCAALSTAQSVKHSSALSKVMTKVRRYTGASNDVEALKGISR